MSGGIGGSRGLRSGESTSFIAVFDFGGVTGPSVISPLRTIVGGGG